MTIDPAAWFEVKELVRHATGEVARDLNGTMLLPNLLWWLANRRPRLLSGRGR